MWQDYIQDERVRSTVTAATERREQRTETDDSNQTTRAAGDTSPGRLWKTAMPTKAPGKLPDEWRCRQQESQIDTVSCLQQRGSAQN